MRFGFCFLKIFVIFAENDLHPMNDITDNLFSNSFIESMTRNIEPDICEDYISRDEIESCWERGIPYRYKYFNSSDNADLFIQANSDGSSDLVKLVRSEGALLASDVKFVVIDYYG